MNARRLWRRGMDQVSAWLPAVLMMLFALGTWWLVRSTAGFRVPGIERPAVHEPDYELHDFTVRNFDLEGRLKTELRGRTGHHYPDTDTYELSEPRMRSYDEAGLLTTGRANQGLSNGDGSEIELHGDAQVVREPGQRPDGGVVPQLEFRGPYLQAWPQARRVRSDQPVELTRGADRFTGDALDYDAETGVADLRGNVRGLLQPTATR